ncbi:CpaE family protein [Streptomyces sp. C10]|uniref:AAA family ATPase n=1 Tax=Streptomyces sp. C10 TaxID=531941 RepID=UPI0039802686
MPLLPPELADGQPRPRRGDPLARRAGRALRRVFASSPAAETAAVTQAAHAIQQPVTTGRQIAVSSIRGGAGKSTVAALLALTFAHYRSDPVLAVEADPALGTLPHRLGAREVRWSGSDLAQIVDASMLITDLTGYLLPFAGGGWLLPGSQGAIGTRLDLDTYRVVMTSLRRHFAATVVDCETLPAEVARTALVTTQARVLVTPATPEGVAATRSVLDWVGGLHSGLLPTTVVVLTHTSPDSGVDVRRAAEHLGAGGAAVLPLPYDRHLAAGGAIRTELLGERTREAAARIAAEVMDRAVSREPGRRQQQRHTTVHPPGQPPVYVPGQATVSAAYQEPQRSQGQSGPQARPGPQPPTGPQPQAQEPPSQPYPSSHPGDGGPARRPQAQHQPQQAPQYYPPQAAHPAPAQHQPHPGPQAQAPTRPPSPSQPQAPAQPPSPSQPPAPSQPQAQAPAPQPMPAMPVPPPEAAGSPGGTGTPTAPTTPDRRSPFDGGPLH